MPSCPGFIGGKECRWGVGLKSPTDLDSARQTLILFINNLPSSFPFWRCGDFVDRQVRAVEFFFFIESNADGALE